MEYPTAVVLSHRINPNNSLSEQTRVRVDRGINLYSTKEVKTLTLSGGHADKEATLTHAKAMRLYLQWQDHDVSEKDIYLEEDSLDTVGQAIFSKNRIIVPKNWERLIVVSHDYHIPRVKTIFDFVYGSDFDIYYVGASSYLQNDPNTIQDENKNLEAFLRTFEDVTPGNDGDILSALFERHPLYKNSQ